MTRLRRRLLVGTVLALLVLVGWFAYVYFRSTDIALQHAEAFHFRRMLVAQLGDEATYRFFFVTNRRLAPGDRELEGRFGTEREESLKFGSFDTRIEPTLGLGMIINPSDWFQNEEIRVLDVQRLEKAKLVAKVRELVDAAPGRSLLVIVHGFREAFPSALRKTAFLGHVLDINTPVLVFDWPGNQGSSLRGYRRARGVAEESGAELARTLEILIREVGPDRLSLIANSMGAQVVVHAFHHLYRNADLADAGAELEDVVLTAPDADHEEFNEHFRDEILALTRDLTVYVSSNDRALLVSRLINRGQRLGESTLEPGNPDQSEETAGFLNMLEGGDDRLTLVDVTPVNRTRNFHNFSLETPEFFDDLYLRLTAGAMPRTRQQYPVRTPEGTVYWVLTRGR